jgi:hypothetical protein
MILSALISSLLVLNSSAADCSSSMDIKTCLQQAAINSLAEQQEPLKTQLIQIVMDQKIEGFNVNTVEDLTNAFSIEVPETTDTLSTKSNPCFDWSNSAYNRARGYGRERIYNIVTNQMKEVAVFLRNYHAFSLGKESSYLYQIRRVEICQGSDEITFDKNVLKIGLSLDYDLINEPYFTGREIFEQWNDGTIVFGQPLGMFGKIHAGMNKDVEALLKDRLRAAWIALNPIGSIRQTLRIAIAKETFSELKKILSSTLAPEDIVVNAASEYNLRDQGKDSVSVAEKWVANLQDPSFINQITEQALFARNVGAYRLTNNDQRKQLALFAIKNNKQINVDLSGLFATAYSQEDLLGEEANVSEISLNSSSWQVSAIAIDLVDQVNVNVSVPTNLVSTIKKLALKKALE